MLVDPLHPNTRMHILHTALYTFPMELARRIYLMIKSFFKLLTLVCNASHPYGSKDFKKFLKLRRKK